MAIFYVLFDLSIFVEIFDLYTDKILLKQGKTTPRWLDQLYVQNMIAVQDTERRAILNHLTELADRIGYCQAVCTII